MSKNIKPFLRWVGGKHSLANELKKFFPKDFKSLNYVEPMLGGAGMYFKFLPKSAYLSDINEKLIITYKSVKNEVNAVIMHLKLHEKEHKLNNEYFYNVRKQFNKGFDSQSEIAAAFIYLNKTNFNGLYRVNNNGEFNVPKGRSTSGKVTICDEENLKSCSNALKHTTIECKSYEGVLKDTKINSFVYLDPPYLPQTDVSFTKYSKDGFTIEDHQILAENCIKLSQRGIKFMMSNAENDYTYDIYGKFSIKPLTVYHSLGPDKKTRKKAKECIITNY
jgi:DNA adenine methylase